MILFILTFILICTTTEASAFEFMNIFYGENPFNEEFVRLADDDDHLVEIEDFSHAKIVYQEKEKETDLQTEKSQIEKVSVNGNKVKVCNVYDLDKARTLAIQSITSKISKTSISSSSKTECNETPNGEGCIYEMATLSQSIAEADSIDTDTTEDNCFLFTFNNISTKGTNIKDVDQISAFDKTDTYDNTSYVTINVVNTNNAVYAEINGKDYYVNTGYPLKFKGPVKLNVSLYHPDYSTKSFVINIPEKPQFITRNISLLKKDKSKEKIVNKQKDWNIHNYKICDSDNCDKTFKEKFFSTFEYTKDFDLTKVKKDMTDAQKRDLIYTDQNALAGVVFAITTEKFVATNDKVNNAIVVTLNTLGIEDTLGKQKEQTKYLGMFKDQRNNGWKNPRPHLKIYDVIVTIYGDEYKKLLSMTMSIVVDCANKFETGFTIGGHTPTENCWDYNKIFKESPNLTGGWYFGARNLSNKHDFNVGDNYTFYSPFIYRGNTYKNGNKLIHTFSMSKRNHITKVDYKIVKRKN